MTYRHHYQLHWSSMWRKAPSRALWFWDIGQVDLGNGGFCIQWYPEGSHVLGL